MPDGPDEWRRALNMLADLPQGSTEALLSASRDQRFFSTRRVSQYPLGEDNMYALFYFQQ